MSRSKVDFKDLIKLQKKLEKMEKEQIPQFSEECVRELATRLLAKVKKRTPVGKGIFSIVRDENGNKVKYKKGKNKGKVKMARITAGGTLRRGWTVGNITRNGDVYSVEIVNPTEYASYVEYGHRQQPGKFIPTLGKRLKKGWVEGRFMMTISVQELETDAPRIIENKLKQFLGECFRDN